MEKKYLMTIIGLTVIASVFIFAAKATLGAAAPANIVSGNIVGVSAQPSGEKQVVSLSFKNGNYYPNTIRVKKGIPVVIEVDTASVRGCYRGIMIPAFSIRKTITESDNKIEFTPGKAGTFGFSCYMGMGTGTLIVEDESGSVPANVNTVSQDVPKNSGGCGCGSGNSCSAV